MRLLKIGAIWCGGCLIMNKTISKIVDNYKIDYSELDLDMDEEEAKAYNPGDKLPVFIVLDNDQEVTRFTGEYSYDEFKNKLIEAGVINEED